MVGRGEKRLPFLRKAIVKVSKKGLKKQYFFKFYFIFKLYIIVLVLPNIKMT